MLNTALEIVRASGNIIRENATRPRHVTHKGRIDLVTETDLAVEAYLKQHLQPLMPQATFMAEESAQKVGIPEATCWIIDPVDGTTNFVHGLPMVATSVALWHEGRIELGIINIPLIQECFYAARGQGAFCNGVPLSVSSNACLEDAVVATGFPYDIPRWKTHILRWFDVLLPQCQGMRRMGAAAVDLAYVAAGRLDAFYEPSLKPWDVAAGWLLVEEAGGKVTALGENSYSFDADIILASNAHLHAILTQCLQSCCVST